jgi:hypothetical protein
VGNITALSNKSGKKGLYGTGGRMNDSGVDIWVHRCFYCRGDVNSRQAVEIGIFYYAHPRCKKRNDNKDL